MKSLLLEKYPEVYDVRIAAPVIDKEHPIQRLVVIPSNGKMDNADPLKPAFNPARLKRMTEYLLSLASPWLKLRLENPSYKEVPITYTVDFAEGINVTYGKRELQQALKRHYMPWGWDGASVVQIGEQLDHFEMIRFIQQLKYVEKVKQLTIDGKEVSESMSQAIPSDISTSVSILTFKE
jgi:hypothetical protein